jgi:hypothetical protein
VLPWGYIPRSSSVVISLSFGVYIRSSPAYTQRLKHEEILAYRFVHLNQVSKQVRRHSRCAFRLVTCRDESVNNVVGASVLDKVVNVQLVEAVDSKFDRFHRKSSCAIMIRSRLTANAWHHVSARLRFQAISS